MTSGLLDTSVVVDWHDPAVLRALPAEMAISAVTAAELAAGPLLASSGAHDIQAAMIEEVQHAHRELAGSTEFRSAQSRVRLTVEDAFELMRKGLQEARDIEQDDLDKVVVTVFVHPSSAAE